MFDSAEVEQGCRCVCTSLSLSLQVSKQAGCVYMCGGDLYGHVSETKCEYVSRTEDELKPCSRVPHSVLYTSFKPHPGAPPYTPVFCPL